MQTRLRILVAPEEVLGRCAGRRQPQPGGGIAVADQLERQEHALAGGFEVPGGQLRGRELGHQVTPLLPILGRHQPQRRRVPPRRGLWGAPLRGAGGLDERRDGLGVPLGRRVLDVIGPFES